MRSRKRNTNSLPSSCYPSCTCRLVRMLLAPSPTWKPRVIITTSEYTAHYALIIVYSISTHVITDSVVRNKLSMSRKEKKVNKLERKLERDTRETRATESRTYISLVRSKIANIVFSIYLHILKLERSGPLLSPALEGVSHFSHVISVEYFLDLLRFLSELLSSPSTHLSTKQRLYCLHTSCTVLFSQQTQDLSVDPRSICQHMYTLLLDLPSELPPESTKLLINTLLLMLNNTQCMHQERALGFAKRICTCSLVKTTSYAAGLLFSLRSLLRRDFITDNLLTNDSLAGASYQPEIPDPDVCEAKSTCLWELSLLRSHYHPVIRKQAHYLSEGSALVGKRNSLKLASDKFHTCDEILEATSLYHTDPFEDIKLEQLIESKKKQERVVKKYHSNLLGGVARVHSRRKLTNSGIFDFYNALRSK